MYHATDYLEYGHAGFADVLHVLQDMLGGEQLAHAAEVSIGGALIRV